MRIAFFIDVFPRISNTFILNQITGLIDRGHEVDIFAPKLGDLRTIHADVENYRLLERLRHIPVPRNYLLRLLKAAALLTRPSHWHASILEALNIAKYGRSAASLSKLYTTLSFLEAKPYDIVHCQFGGLGVSALPLLQAGVISGKLVTSFRGADLTKKLREDAGFYRDLFRVGHLFLPVTEVFKKRLITEGCPSSRILVHHSGIACDRFKYRERHLITGEDLRVLFVGRLTEKKGAEFAVEAIAKLLAMGRTATLTLVGDGKLRSDIEWRIKKLGLASHVQLAGGQPQQGVIRHLQKAHVLVAPSITTDTGDQEGIPNVLKEAMATGMPVVSTRHSGIPELVEDGVSGFLVPERDVDALVERLVYLADHPQDWGRMGKAGRVKVETEFDIDILNDQLVQKYQKLLGIPSDPAPRMSA